MNIKKQNGGQLVEFAMVGLVFIMVTVAIFEFSRIMFTWNALTEAVRRGARVAVVCPKNDPAIKNIAVFDSFDGSGTSPVVKGFTTADITLEYLPDAEGKADAFVRVSTDIELTSYIPLIGGLINSPVFTTTVPAEGLGVVPTYPDEEIQSPNCEYNEE